MDPRKPHVPILVQGGQLLKGGTLKKKELKKYPTSTIIVSRVMEEQRGSNQQTLEASPGCTPTPSVYPNS